MHSLLVDEGFWNELEELLPERPAQRTGRPRVSDRAAFTAIMFVLLTGVPWRMVPKEIGCSGVTAWRRLVQVRVWRRRAGRRWHPRATTECLRDKRHERHKCSQTNAVRLFMMYVHFDHSRTAPSRRRGKRY